MNKISLSCYLLWLSLSSIIKTALTKKRIAQRDFATEVSFVVSKRLIHASKKRPIAWLRHVVNVVASTSPEQKQVNFEETNIAGVNCQWCKPKQSKAGSSFIVYIHGGGYVIGSIKQYSSLISSIAVKADMPVLAIDYRLGPEYPFPAAQKDCYDVVKSLLQEKPESKLIIMGDSAGGGLAINTLYMLAQQKVQPQVAGSVLISPYVKLLDDSPSIEQNRYSDILDNELVHLWYDLAKVDLSKADGHLLSFCDLDLSFMPPTYVQAASNEILIDQIQHFISVAEKSGVKLNYDIYTGLFHDFQMFHPVIKDATQAIEQIAQHANTFINE